VNLKKKLLKSALRPLGLIVFTLALVLAGHSQAAAQRSEKKVVQPPQVVEAYRVCNQFQQLLAQDLDFSRAFEATFTKNQARRREIALAEGEFGPANLSKVDDAILIEAYKNRMQMLILLLPLLGEDEKSLPPAINDIFDRGNPRTTEEFLEFTTQLKQDVANLRAHTKELVERSPAFAENLRNYKAFLAKPLQVPANYIVKPITFYSKGHVLPNNVPYYRIADYSVIREGREMKLIGVQFFKIGF
jgi:hypothetical protein